MSRAMPEASATLKVRASDRIRWAAPADVGPVPPATRIELLQRAVAAAPRNALLAQGLGEALLDQLEFEQATAWFETALGLSPTSATLRIRLAQCLATLRRFAEALGVLDADWRAESPEVVAEASYLRGACLMELERLDAAESELRSALALRPSHSPTFRKLATLLSQAGRRADLYALCEQLLGQGVRHARLLMEWGCALGAKGRIEASRRVLLDPDRVRCADLEGIEGFPTIGAFNAALRDELLSHPYATVGYAEELTYPGGPRVHHLLHGRRPDLLRGLYAVVEREVGRFLDAVTPYPDEPDHWLQAAPRRATLSSWCIVQSEARHLDWHVHPNGWMQGVYYVSVPATTTIEGDGPGCLEFGPPPEAAARFAGEIDRMRIAPRAGMLILSPSQYHHRSLPTRVSEPRIIVAFDVVPRADEAAADPTRTGAR